MPKMYRDIYNLNGGAIFLITNLKGDQMNTFHEKLQKQLQEFIMENKNLF